jgi:hypothetical protein
MINQLTSELNRINQGCGDGFGYRNPETGLLKYSCNKEHLCPTCQKEKETLNKVSLMWADEEISFLDELQNKTKDIDTMMFCKLKMMKLKEIKSLMEKSK